MATPKETALSISRLTLDEIPESGSNSSPSGSRCHETVAVQPAAARLESFIDEMVASPCMKMAEQDMDVSNTFTKKSGESDVLDINKARQMAIDERHGDGACTQQHRRGDIAETSYEVHKGNDININENYGTVIIDLGSQCCDHSTTSFFAETIDNPHLANPCTHSAAKSPPIISGGLRSSQNARQNRRFETKGANRRLRQTKINFRQRKRRTNLKSVSGQKCRVSDYKNAVNPTVNINVFNNKGNVVIGDDVTYCDRRPGRNTGDQLTADGVVADGDVVADGGVVVRPSPQSGPVFFIDKNAMKWLERFYSITNELYPLRDNGMWENFYEKIETGLRLARQNGLDEVEIFLTIEKSTALSYQKRNDESKEMVKQAKDMILGRPGLTMREFLIALSHCQLAALYRRESKLSKSNNALSIAERNVEVVPSDLARAYVIYEKASNLYIQHSYLSRSKQDKDNFAELAKKEFRNCISTCERLLSEKDTVYLRRHHFCYVKLALLNLDSVTTQARNQPVSEACIREAGDCITRMQQRYSGEMGGSTTMLLHAAETDHFHRRGDYANAEICARKALHKAESLGFQLEIKELQERVEHMSLLKQQQEQPK